MMLRTRLLAAGLMLATLVGCGGGPGPISAQAYKHAQTVYALANHQASDRIDVLAEKIDADTASGALSETETEWLNGLLGNARAGEWQAAADGARQMLEDQVQR